MQVALTFDTLRLGRGRTIHELVERVMPGEGIVLLHAWPAVTAEGLGRVIAGLRERGADFVTVAD